MAKIHPDQVTLVPDPPHALTSNAGWRVGQNEKFLRRTLQFLRQKKIRSSLFIDVFTWRPADFSALSRLHPDRIELYTEHFAKYYVTSRRQKTTNVYKRLSEKIHTLGIGINAGHDLNLKNVRFLVRSIPQIEECSIGHALISDSLYFGFQKTIQNYLEQMRRSRSFKVKK